MATQEETLEALRRGLINEDQARALLAPQMIGGDPDAPQFPTGPLPTVEEQRLGPLESAGKAFTRAVGSRVGLDEPQFSNIFSPLTDVAAGVGDIALGGIAAGANLVGSGVGALLGDQERGRRDITALATETPLLGTPPIPQTAVAAGGLAKRAISQPRQAPRPGAAQAADALPPQAPLARPVPPVQEVLPPQAARQPGLRAQAVGKINQQLDRAFPVDKKISNNLADALSLDDIGFDAIRARVLDVERRTGQRPTLLEVGGENVKGLARQAGGEIGEGRRIIENFRNTVLEGQTAQLQEIAERTLTTPNKNFFTEVSALEKQMQVNAAPLYEQAFAQSISVTEDISDLLNTPAGLQAAKRAIRISKQERSPIGLQIKKGKVIVGDEAGTVGVKTLDTVKRGFDDFIEGFRDKTTGRLVLDQFGRASNKTLREFIGEVDELSPVYAEARAAFAGPATLRNALNDGRNAFKSNRVRAEDITARFENFTASEKDFYRSGVLRGMLDQVTSATDKSNRLAKIGKSEALRAKIAAAFDGDTKAANAFLEQLGEQIEKVSRAQFVSPNVGSQTQLRGADLASFGSTSGRGLIGEGARALLKSFRSQRGIRNQQLINKDIAELLTQPLTDDLLLEIQKRLSQ